MKCAIRNNIYHVSSTSAGPENHRFAILLTSESGENVVPDHGRNKSSQKRRRCRPNGARGVHMAPQGYPMVSNMAPKSIKKLFKTEVPGPGPPQRLPKAAPGPQKSQKSMENRCKAASHPLGKIRGSDALQKTSSGVSPQNLAEKNCTVAPSVELRSRVSVTTLLYMYTSPKRGGLGEARVDNSEGNLGTARL